MPRPEPIHRSKKKNGIIKAYAALTNHGIIRYSHEYIPRNYNEDRVSILLNVLKPKQRISEEWPKCSFFAIYDGHGGSFTSDFLKENLHKYIMKQPSFPFEPTKALIQGFENAEKEILGLQLKNKNRSGSCAIVTLIVGDMCYIANVGDSRAILAM